MYETGQPLHTFDADLITGNSIIIKTANANQQFETLDGKERILDDRMLLICDAEQPIAIVGGGVMGSACAWRLSLAGLRVVLLEQSPSNLHGLFR